MKISSVIIENFKSIRHMEINDIDNAFILVGKNNTGKTAALDAIRAVAGDYVIEPENFNVKGQNVEITVTLDMDDEDLYLMNQSGVVSKYKRYELWYKDFTSKLPSYQDGKLKFTYIVNKDGKARYNDGFRKNNIYIPQLFPKVYYIDNQRDITDFEDGLLRIQGNDELNNLKQHICMFDKTRKCNNCFDCIGVINKKSPEELTITETSKLMEYKIYNIKLDKFAETVNQSFRKNGAYSQSIKYGVHYDAKDSFRMQTMVYNEDRDVECEINSMSAGLKSIYLLSLIEAYIQENNKISNIVMIEDPESYLHPQLQKSAGEILYKLSKKNQVIFSTHSPNMIFNFNSRQIKQVYIDNDGYTQVREKPDIDRILNDLGYSANDLMNVSFVFFVEGKQDESRLPLLLRKYYAETYDEDGQLRRVAIIATNSCTNIKTYANLKYINKLYIKDQFLMIRDGDAKDADELKRQLCGYYRDRGKADKGNLPRVTEKNVLILKYYSFENYFLDPNIMAKIGVVKSADQFYDILYAKYKEYLFKLKSMKNMCERLNLTIESREDIIDNMENIRIYVRGHNLYDIFYGRYKGEKERDILNRYIEEADRDTFKDILDAIDSFVYFENKKTDSSE